MSSSGGSAAAAAASTARHYAVLGVAPGSSEAVIKKAYYAAALKDHPDKNPGDAQAAARFMAIHAAYEALQDEALRQEYERYMSAQAAAAVRASEMDVGRKRLRSELEAREAAAAQAAAASRAPAQGAGGQVAGSRVARGATTDARIAALRAEGRDAMAAAHVAGVATRAAASSAGVAGSVAGGATASAAFNLTCSVRVRWDAGMSEAVGSQVMYAPEDETQRRTLSNLQLEALFAPVGRVVAVLAHKHHSAVLVFDSPGAAADALLRPPAGFNVQRVHATPSVEHIAHSKYVARADAGEGSTNNLDAASRGMHRARTGSASDGGVAASSRAVSVLGVSETLAAKEARVLALLRATRRSPPAASVPTPVSA